MILTLNVHPRAKANRIEPADPTTFRVWVTAAAEDGKANDAVIRLLAAYLKIAKTNITIIRGALSRKKIVRTD